MMYVVAIQRWCQWGMLIIIVIITNTNHTNQHLFRSALLTLVCQRLWGRYVTITATSTYISLCICVCVCRLRWWQRRVAHRAMWRPSIVCRSLLCFVSLHCCCCCCRVLNATGYDSEVDLWSVGVITYILLCGCKTCCLLFWLSFSLLHRITTLVLLFSLLVPPFYGDTVPDIFGKNLFKINRNEIYIFFCFLSVDRILKGKFDYPADVWICLLYTSPSPRD